MDATRVHVVLRQDVRCTSCHKQIYCSDSDVKRHFQVQGIHAVVAMAQAPVDRKVFKGAGSGRKAVWHTVPFIASLYQTLRQTRSLEALRTAYMSKLQTRAMESECVQGTRSIVLQYWL